MREIGRLRELSFRAGGGGTGKELDIDEYDFMEKPYKQLIVWNRMRGNHRRVSIINGRDVPIDKNGQPTFVMSHLFTF